MRILVLGVGNILLTDEAIGVRIVEALEQRYILPDYVEILDGGTAGMELLGDMANRDHLIIADAIVSKKNAPGTMMILRDEEVPALFTNKISPHQLAHRRRRLRRDLHEIQALFIRDFESADGCHDAQLLAGGADQADLLVADLLVQFMHYFANGRNTSLKNTKTRTPGRHPRSSPGGSPHGRKATRSVAHRRS